VPGEVWVSATIALTFQVVTPGSIVSTRRTPRQAPLFRRRVKNVLPQRDFDRRMWRVRLVAGAGERARDRSSVPEPGLVIPGWPARFPRPERPALLHVENGRRRTPIVEAMTPANVRARRRAMMPPKMFAPAEVWVCRTCPNPGHAPGLRCVDDPRSRVVESRGCSTAGRAGAGRRKVEAAPLERKVCCRRRAEGGRPATAGAPPRSSR